MIIVRNKDGLFFKLKGHATEWVANEDDATVFSSVVALAQCFFFGRLAHHGLKFKGWRKLE